MSIGDFAQVVATYDVVAGDYAAHFPGTEPEDPLELAVIDHFVARLGASPTVLDAGCGTGRMSRYLADRGCRVSGLDLSPGMLSMARRDHPDLVFAVGSILSLPHADDSFDALFYWYSVIHSPDDLQPHILAEAVRVLRPGGHVLLAFQVGAGSRDVATSYRALGHDVALTRHHRTVARMVELLVDAGLEVVTQVERGPVAGEKDPQGFLVARRPDRADPR